MCTYIYIYIYIHIASSARAARASCRRRASARPRNAISHVIVMASFHKFKSQDFKSSVSNPKNKHVAYVSVLSQISNCQGLGRKNNFKCLKTYRSGISMSCHIMLYTYSIS